MFSRGSTGPAALLGLFMIAAPTAQAETITYDFNTGLGANFTVLNASGLFAVTTVGEVRAVKPADNVPQSGEFISGGVVSAFKLGGDFSATVDVKLNGFPSAVGQNMLNEAVLGAYSILPGGSSVSVLRFRLAASNQLEVFASDPPGNPGTPLGIQGETANEGRFRLTRVNNTLSGFFDAFGEAGFGTEAGFEFVASTVVDDEDAFNLVLAAVQGANSGIRSSTALDISFDNLIVVAEFIVPPPDTTIPEPETLALLALGLTGIALARPRCGGTPAHRRAAPLQFDSM